MARIYQARQRKPDGRWDMTVSSDEEGWCHAIGYCAGWKEWTEADAARLALDWPGIQRDMEERRTFQGNYHTDGHQTAGEAESCWQRFRLDQELRFRESADTQKKCEICGEWTSWWGELGHELPTRWPLCLRHQSREVVEGILRQGKLAV